MNATTWRRDLLSGERLRALHRRSDAAGLARLAGHALALAVTTGLIVVARGPWLVPAMAAHGVVLTFLFAPLHECLHRTAFADRRLNAAVAWVCGALLMLPPRYFRAFHFAHHRWTQDAARDPELALAKPASRAAYALWLSGLPYWRERLATTLGHALGRYRPGGFLGAGGRAAIVAEARALWALYGAIAAAAVAAGSAAPLLFWVVPALLGQPFLRAFLLAEHGDCPRVPDMLVNSRTTRSNAVVRWLAWNMPYHAEHHAFPSVPFHALPALHGLLRPRLGTVSPGYVRFHRAYLRALTAPG